MLKGPILLAIAMDADENVSPIMVCTSAGFVQGSSKTDFSFPLRSAMAILTAIPVERQVSYIL